MIAMPEVFRLLWSSRRIFAMVALTSSGTTACVPGLSQIRDDNIKAQHSVALLEGYEAYETLMSDTDTDIVWFTYRLPRGSTSDQASGKIAARITARDPCYRTAESTDDAMRLRCPDQAGPGFREYFISTPRDRPLVFVMYAAIRGAVEQDAYPRVLTEFKEEVESRLKP